MYQLLCRVHQKTVGLEFNTSSRWIPGLKSGIIVPPGFHRKNVGEFMICCVIKCNNMLTMLCLFTILTKKWLPIAHMNMTKFILYRGGVCNLPWIFFSFFLCLLACLLVFWKLSQRFSFSHFYWYWIPFICALKKKLLFLLSLFCKDIFIFF